MLFLKLVAVIGVLLLAMVSGSGCFGSESEGLDDVPAYPQIVAMGVVGGDDQGKVSGYNVFGGYSWDYKWDCYSITLADEDYSLDYDKTCVVVVTPLGEVEDPVIANYFWDEPKLIVYMLDLQGNRVHRAFSFAILQEPDALASATD